MDPNQAFADLVSDILAGDAESAEEHARDLAEWIDRGGFPPDTDALEAIREVFSR